MKLISCHIENYGGLSNCDFTFTDGFNVILRENGWGKTTLASFIKAMLYGFPQSNRRGLAENDRKHYAPWQGGNFGGSLCFEKGGKRYCIERFFGSKLSEDTFDLFDMDSNLKSGDFPENVGEAVFGLDEESFARTAFLPQKQTSPSLTNSISAKLTDMLESADDIGNLDSALMSLEKTRKFYVLRKGSGGMVYNTQVRISELDREITACAGAAETAERAREKCAELSQRINLGESKIAEWEAGQKQINEFRLKKAQYERFAALKSVRDEAQKKFDGLREYFRGEPDESALKECSENAERMARLESALETLDKNTPQRLTDLNGFFANREPDVAETEKYITGYREAMSAADENDLRTGKNPDSKSFLPSMVIITFLGVAAVAAGLFLKLSAVYIGAAVLTVIADAVVFAMKKRSESRAAAEISAKISAEKKKSESALDTVRKYTEQFPVCETELSAALYEIKSKAEELIRLRGEQEENDRKISRCRGELEDCKARVNGFIRKLEPDGDVNLSLAKIRENALGFKTAESALDEASKRLEAFISEAGSEPVAPPEMAEDAAESFEKRLAEARQLLKNLMGEQATLLRRIDELTSEAERLDMLIDERDDLNENLKEYTERINVIDNTESYLKKASESLSLRYFDPTVEAFGKYASMLNGEKLADFVPDTELNLTGRRFGKSREIGYFSDGSRDMAELCLRLALVDSLFSDEPPFIMMDDPLVHMDDNNITNALSMLREMAQNRQILYFTCSTRLTGK